MKLDEFLKSIEMSYPKFAKLIGWDPRYLMLVSKGKHNPSIRLCRDIEKATYGKVTTKELRFDEQLKVKQLVEAL